MIIRCIHFIFAIFVCGKPCKNWSNHFFIPVNNALSIADDVLHGSQSLRHFH